jgi:hypothetical protein
MKLHHLLLLCAFAIFLGGCKSSTSPGDPTTIQQLFPLAYGNYWTYDQKVFNSDGSIQNETTQTNEIIGTQPVHGHQGFNADFGSGAGILYFSGSDLLQVQSDSSVPQVMLHYPMYMGQTITLQDTTIVFKVDTAVLEILSQNVQLTFHSAGDQVIVPAGTFSCYHFENRSITAYQGGTYGKTDTSSLHLYYSPGVGLIRETVYASDSGTVKLVATQELMSYRVK